MKRPDPPLRVALAYGYDPSGHAEAARALEAALREGGRVETVRVDLASDLHPVLGPVLAKAYLELIRRTPAVWEAVYDHSGIADATKELRDFAHLIDGLRLAAQLKELRPDLVACTHALPCGLLSAAKRRGKLRVPLVAVPTDFAAHAYWIHPEVDLYLAPSEEARGELIRRGCPPDKVKVTGIPIQPRFAQLPSQAKARRRLKLAGPLILITGGSKGLGPVSEIVEELRRAAPRATLLVLCGTNEDLHQRLRRVWAGDPKVRPFRFQKRPADLLAAADLVVGKGGGLTLSEALAAGIPPLVFQPIPGQETRNARALIRAGAAIEAGSLAELGRTARRLLDRPAELETLKARVRALGRPRSALDAAREIRALLESS